MDASSLLLLLWQGVCELGGLLVTGKEGKGGKKRKERGKAAKTHHSQF